jgi:hypothetical protein
MQFSLRESITKDAAFGIPLPPNVPGTHCDHTIIKSPFFRYAPREQCRFLAASFESPGGIRIGAFLTQ